MKIIAESAFNHNGDIKYLKSLALEAKKSKADFFTVQIYKTSSFCDINYKKYSICEETELSEDEWISLFEYCNELKLDIIPCVLDNYAFKLVYENGYRLLKIHATDMLNDEILTLIKNHEDVRILLETQCATIRDINYAYSKIGSQIEAIFHGFSNYPTDYDDLELNALDYIAEKWNCKTGLADHSTDIKGVPLIALAKGVSYLEKHITILRSDRHYDWQVSLEPEEFEMMVMTIKKYKRALGRKYKYPVKREIVYRDIMYKKYFVDDEGNYKCKRSDAGLDFYQYKYQNLDKKKVVVTIIARLVSTRLHRKIFKPFKDDLLVFDIINRISKNSQEIDKVVFATSFDQTDDEIEVECKKRNIECYRGEPLSVIDRMLDIGEKENAGAIIRVTGDNPFSDPMIIDELIKLYKSHDLDYVRANNLPFGVTGELFSMDYLARLYREFDPLTSEYLTWFVMLDEDSRKGCLDIVYDERLKRVGLSVDYLADYERTLDIIQKIGKDKFEDIVLRDVIKQLDFSDIVDLERTMKLPEGKTLTFKKYFQILDDLNYIVRKKINI